MFLIGFSSFAAVNDKPNKVLTAHIITSLEDLPLEIEEEILVEVRMKINQQNQIEVIAVAADDPLVRKLVRK